MRPDAKKVFSGVLFDVYQWEQELYDGSVETFERASRIDTVEVFAVLPDKTLLYLEDHQPQREQAFHCLPGGRIDPGEDPLTAAKRELLEEAGYTSDDWETLDQIPLGRKVDHTTYVFIARNCQKIAEPSLDAGERIKVSTITLEALLEEVKQNRFDHHHLYARLLRAYFDPEARTELERQLFG